MLLDPNKTVRELSLALPKVTRVFEKAGIDYCCGGDRLLGDACSGAGVDLQDLELMLAESESAPDRLPEFQTLSMAELIDHIVAKHHTFTRDEMVRLEMLHKKVVNAHAEKHSELLAVGGLLRQLFDDLMKHMFKEEQVLFPYVVEFEQSVQQHRPAPHAPFGSVNNPIRMMMMEHDTAGEILRELRKLTSDYLVPADACASYRVFYEALAGLERDLHQHIHLENNILFPRAIQLENV